MTCRRGGILVLRDVPLPPRPPSQDEEQLGLELDPPSQRLSWLPGHGQTPRC